MNYTGTADVSLSVNHLRGYLTMKKAKAFKYIMLIIVVVVGVLQFFDTPKILDYILGTLALGFGLMSYSSAKKSNSESEFIKDMNAQELYELAMKHIYGDGVPEDNELATSLLMQAHDMGHVEATYNLGICYHYGFGTDVNLKKAFELYLESANKGYGKGQELVGRFYNRGIHVKQDRGKAEYWLTKAMESSDIEAVEEAKKELQVREKTEVEYEKM